MTSSETHPIKTLDELWSWKSHRDGVSKELQKLRSTTYKMTTSKLNDGMIYDFVKIPNQNSKRSKVMVCHDMKGGYIEDRFDQGCYNLAEEPYCFVHWALIDTFVYFSHHLITIPPRGWIQVAHKNGVEMFGTIITESKEGKKICDELLENWDTIDDFVNACCLIAIAHQIDGWLLNIENKLDPDQVPNMLYLLKTLTREMHRRVGSHSKVIWYDSVTHEGELDWQNALNDKNVEYFDDCDGIYLNYGWRIKPEVNDLDETVAFLEKHNGNLDRISDVYVGVDVFGRGCFGGGGFECDKALAEIVPERRGGQLSIAIFAPGWTHETRPKTNYISEMDDQFVEGSFSEREHRFWTLLEDFLHFRSLEFCSKDHTTNLIFSTTFNSGSGIMKDIAPRNADAVKDMQDPSWFLNLDAQDVLPVFFSHSSKKSNPQTLKEISCRPFNIYLSNYSIQNRNFQGKPVNAKDNGTKDTHLLVLDNFRDKGCNWLFCNRISSIPLFLNTITTEKANLLFVLEYVRSLQDKEESNANIRALSILPTPHLIIRLETKKKKEDLTSTLKLCPYSNNKRSCFHNSENQAEKQDVQDVIERLEGNGILHINSEPNRTQYLLNVESLKSKIESKAVTITAVLIETPLGRQKIGLGKFSIYEV